MFSFLIGLVLYWFIGMAVAIGTLALVVQKNPEEVYHAIFSIPDHNLITVSYEDSNVIVGTVFLILGPIIIFLCSLFTNRTELCSYIDKDVNRYKNYLETKQQNGEGQ